MLNKFLANHECPYRRLLASARGDNFFAEMPLNRNGLVPHTKTGMAAPKNGPVGMYKMKPYHDAQTNLELPNCMYNTKPYHEGQATTNNVKGDGSNDGVLANLERRQEAILARLGQLKAEVERLGGGSIAGAAVKTSAAHHQESLNGGLRDLVINVNPKSPPLSLLVLYHLLCDQYKVLAACHTHSSVTNNVSDKLRALFGTIDRDRRGYQLAFTLVWKDVKNGASIMVNPGSQLAIHGEANVARYLARLLTPAYDSCDITMATEIDYYVDMTTQLARGKDKEKASVIKTLNAKLGKSNSWLVGNTLSLADIVLWSAMHQGNQVTTASGNVKRWLDACHQNVAFQKAMGVL